MTHPDDDTLTAAGHAARRMPLGTECAVHQHHVYVPLESHHIWPIGMGGPNHPENRVTVCCNGHYLIHELIRQLMLHDGRVPPELSRHFGYKVKHLAVQGWTEAGRPTSGRTGE